MAYSISAEPGARTASACRSSCGSDLRAFTGSLLPDFRGFGVEAPGMDDKVRQTRARASGCVFRTKIFQHIADKVIWCGREIVLRV